MAAAPPSAKVISSASPFASPSLVVRTWPPASRTLRDLRVAEVEQLDMKIDNGKVIYRAKLKVSFKFHGDE